MAGLVCLEDLCAEGCTELKRIPADLGACPALRCLDFTRCEDMHSLPGAWEELVTAGGCGDAALDAGGLLPALVRLVLPPQMGWHPVIPALRERGVAVTLKGYGSHNVM